MKPKHYAHLALAVVFAMCVAGLTFAYLDDEADASVKIGSTTDSNDLTYDLYDDNTAILTGCINLTGEIIVPAKVTYEGVEYSVTSAETFNGNRNVTSIVFESPSFTMVGAMFNNCTTLTSVKMNTTCIPPSAFNRCTALVSADFGTGVETIGDNAFNGCSKLANLTVGTSVKSIGMSAFMNTYAMSIELSFTNLETIGTQAFMNSVLTKFTASGVASIGRSAFAQCPSLTEVYLKGTFTEIEGYTFRYPSNTALTKITLDGNVSTIGNYAFQYCRALTDLSITGTVTSIGTSAFENCSALTSLGFDISNVTELKQVFKGCSLSPIQYILGQS